MISGLCYGKLTDCKTVGRGVLRGEYEIEHGITKYDVEFHRGVWAYDYEIHAAMGEIFFSQQRRLIAIGKLFMERRKIPGTLN